MAPPSRTVRLLVDVALVGWVVAWVVLGVQVGREVRGLTELSDTVVLAGDAIEQTGDLLEQVGRIPFLGQPVGDLADRIRETGRSAQRDAAATRSDVEDLSVLLALSIALIPTVPLAALWLGLRLRWRRERVAVRRALAAGVPGVDGLLAERGRQTLPLDEVLSLGDDEEALAEAELRRLGLRR
ncbi:MAG: hypothetical protein ICV67_01590 [Thermoleophilia bacterium]|nr:hypothetical protein [Thermoleophilia bacterium]